MAHRISIQNLGPVAKCELDLNQLILLTGPQANGKSTIAKAIFFFRTLKDDIITRIVLTGGGEDPDARAKKRLEKWLRDKFMRLFGSSWSMPDDMKLRYWYDRKTWVNVYLRQNQRWGGGRNYVALEYSQDILDFLRDLDDQIFDSGNPMQLKSVRAKLDTLFHDPLETIFIPAGRSMITLLTSQLSYIFATMEDTQKRGIDYCTQLYIERILKLKASFSGGLDGLLMDKKHHTDDWFDVALVNKLKEAIGQTLKGRYRYDDGEEKLYLDHGSYKQYVKINFASSGQQETVWVFNILFYYLLENRRIFLILEEPESHLYPQAQKQVAEILSLFLRGGNEELITTHSPYILGQFNNLLYAGHMKARGRKGVDRVVDADKQLRAEQVSAYHVLSGEAEPAMDGEPLLIKDELIDGASVEINEENDRLYELEGGGDG